MVSANEDDICPSRQIATTPQKMVQEVNEEDGVTVDQDLLKVVDYMSPMGCNVGSLVGHLD